MTTDPGEHNSAPVPNIERYFDELTQRYNYDNATADQDWAVNRLLRGAFRQEELAGVHDVLDLGAGTGQTVTAIKELTTPSRIVAVDASDGMLKSLREKYPNGEVEIVHALIEDYAKGRGEFDLITAIAALEFVPRLPEVLSDVSGLLKPGGSLAITYIPRTNPDVFERPFDALGTRFMEYYWSPEEVEAALTEQGLRVTTGETFEAYTRGKGEQVNYNFLVARKPAVE